MRVLVYSRVSTDAQERDGTSLDTQERACLDFVSQQGWRVVEVVRDVASGFSLDREGIDRVRELLRVGAVDVVVAYAVDRLSRNQNQIGVIFDAVQQAGARLEFVTERFEDTAVGRFILAARAFIAEVEREKIVERTTRGKLERAKSGRIPQAFGRGCYGYVYNPTTGQRDIEPFQAEIVRRMFRRFAETRSFSAVSNELNDEGIPAHLGPRWYANTIRNMLRNESYAGRMFFNRTRWTARRSGTDGKRRRVPVARPAEEWVEIPGASPQIIDEALWQRVQDILADNERKPKHTKIRIYPMRGRLRCGVCGSAMVGRTMSSKGSDYRYYGCRHIYDRRTGTDCNSRYVRADDLEQGLWQEVRKVLSDPRVVLNEMQRDSEPDGDAAELEVVEAKVASLAARENRLVTLFSYGEVDEKVIRAQIAEVRREQIVLNDRLRSLRPAPRSLPASIDEARLIRTCQAVARWLDQADDAKKRLALEALQISVVATREQATVSGVLPLDLPEFFILPRASACTSACTYRSPSTGTTPRMSTSCCVARMAI
ncbi:MAG: recombinase family protein [Vicinamibacterales bacterium]